VPTSSGTARKQRRPACNRCFGSGYVYLWSVARVGPRTWYCDRCKRSWSDADPSAAVLDTVVVVKGAPPVVLVR
jgi:hypothetical protein